MTRPRLQGVVLGLAASLLLLGACAAPRVAPNLSDLPKARPPVAAPPAAPLEDKAPERPGWSAGAVMPPTTTPAPASTGIEPRRPVNVILDRAPIAAAADAVLGETLQRSFRVDPRVSGEVSIRLIGQMSETEVLTTFDQALRASGSALTGSPGGGIAIVPASSAPSFSPLPGGSGPSGGAFYAGGVAVYRARNVSAAELTRLLAPLAENRAQVRADANRENVYISGDPGTVNSLVRTAEMFDVDWMQGRSFQYYPLKYAAAKSVADDVRRLYGGPDGPVGTQVELIDITRLNAIIIAAKSPAILAQTADWIDRLDQPASPSEERLRVVPLSNLRAEDLVKVIGDLFTKGAPPAGTLASGDGSGGSSGSVTADPRSNSIIMFANDAEYQSLLQIVRRLDVPPSQVLIEATVAEVRLNDQMTLGVQWYLENNGLVSGGLQTVQNGAVSLTYPGLSLRYLGVDFKAAINALSKVTDVEVVSTPRMLVLANETANLQVGDQVPVITQSSTGTQDNSLIINSVQYRDTGVLLSVTPRVGEGGRIFIDIQQEVSDVSTTNTSKIDSPTIQQRKFKTQISVEDGQVIAMGGLIRTTKSKGDSGVPLLSRIPVMGALFRERSTVNARTELVVFLKATLVRNRAEADLATDEIAAGLKALGFGRARP